MSPPVQRAKRSVGFGDPVRAHAHESSSVRADLLRDDGDCLRGKASADGNCFAWARLHHRFDLGPSGRALRDYSCYSCYSPRPHRIHPIVTALYTRRVHLVAAWEAELGARPSTPPSMPRCHSSDELRKRQGGCSLVPPRGPTMGCDNAGPRYDQRAKLHSPTDEG